MKKILLLVIVGAFLVTGSLVSQVFSKQQFMVNCCVKGQCKYMSRPECQRLGGTIVQNCGQCK